MKKGFLCVVALVFGLGMIGMIADQADARPKYLGGFIKKYPGVKAEASKAKCGICHPEKDKKVRNDYAKAFGKGLPEKNTKGAE